ncbi:hypothetical protein D3C87_1333860 [compost metagenome]
MVIDGADHAGWHIRSRQNAFHHIGHRSFAVRPRDTNAKQLLRGVIVKTRGQDIENFPGTWHLQNKTPVIGGNARTFFDYQSNGTIHNSLRNKFVSIA